MANASVVKFQEQLNGATTNVRNHIEQAVLEAANSLATTMRMKVPRGATGKLRGSIRVERSPKRTPVTYLVRAGGKDTTVHKYDYSIATEFGTAKESAQPFFWPSYRRRRSALNAMIINKIRYSINTAVPVK